MIDRHDILFVCGDCTDCVGRFISENKKRSKDGTPNQVGESDGSKIDGLDAKIGSVKDELTERMSVFEEKIDQLIKMQTSMQSTVN